jgi:hypothetical protein
MAGSRMTRPSDLAVRHGPETQRRLIDAGERRRALHRAVGVTADGDQEERHVGIDCGAVT